MFPTIKFNIERWKYNPTFEIYVSNMGHIRNKSKADIAPKIMENGYVVVYVNGSINGYMLLHRVVMLTWKPTPEAEKLTVDHLDHNKRNNALSNLEWVTLEENLRRAHEDYVGKICPCGCEFIKTLNFQKGKATTLTVSQTKPNPNSKRSQKKARKDAYLEKMSQCIGFDLICNENNCTGMKILGREKMFIANCSEGYKGFQSILSKHSGVYNLFKDKFDAMLNGENQTGGSHLFGIKIIPVFDESAAIK